ncbi:hypothetical protein CMQ_3154 [Grosmannia clavigera kw1407]|uniref:Vacuolar ATPase assembly protein VMA22 n=1 Tax=Grosmannia clavigera (strain kw1407 / UAMH 11150) TaxID=655863 RepID=F0XH01_GROCL|nr:uncharacterized protein CMQ_3154 [Grosmannia clavigera kw1407]EFX03225.1 hypothetical protein CMQ_3154 [Grosmannia clavigera kw1407]
MTLENIDDLLVRYLGLLDEYTRLRESLVARQTAMYGQLTRANFAAERGFRYGPDHFDGRMQATARVEMSFKAEVNGTTGDVPSFSICRPAKPVAKEESSTGGSTDKAGNEAGETGKKAAKVVRPLRDPLQWFGMLTPMALRLAQKEAIEAVDSIVPRLASVNAEMAAVEIEVRRARKKRARAEAAREKEQQATAADMTRHLDGADLETAA